MVMGLLAVIVLPSPKAPPRYSESACRWQAQRGIPLPRLLLAQTTAVATAKDARIIYGFTVRETGIAKTGRRAAPTPLHCVRHPRHAGNANRGPTAILCATGCRETAPRRRRCAAPLASQYPARCAVEDEPEPLRQNAK